MSFSLTIWRQSYDCYDTLEWKLAGLVNLILYILPINSCAVPFLKLRFTTMNVINFERVTYSFAKPSSSVRAESTLLQCSSKELDSVILLNPGSFRKLIWQAYDIFTKVFSHFIISWNRLPMTIKSRHKIFLK